MNTAVYYVCSFQWDNYLNTMIITLLKKILFQVCWSLKLLDWNAECTGFPKAFGMKTFWRDTFLWNCLTKMSKKISQLKGFIYSMMKTNLTYTCVQYMSLKTATSTLYLHCIHCFRKDGSANPHVVIFYAPQRLHEVNTAGLFKFICLWTSGTSWNLGDMGP